MAGEEYLVHRRAFFVWSIVYIYCFELRGEEGTFDEKLYISIKRDIVEKRYGVAYNKIKEFEVKCGGSRYIMQVLLDKGLCEEKGGKKQQALNTYKDLVKRADVGSEVWYRGMERVVILSKELGQREEFERGLLKLRQAGVSNDVVVRVYSLLGRERMGYGDYKGASEYYGVVSNYLCGEALEEYEVAKVFAGVGGVNKKALLSYGEKLYSKDRVDQARKVYEHLLRQRLSEEEWAEASVKLGWCKYVEMDYDGASKLWEGVISRMRYREKWRGEARWHMIQLNAGPLGKWGEAIKLCEEQGKEFKGDGLGMRGLFSRAWLYMVHKEYEKGLKAFEEFLKEYPEYEDDPPIKRYIEECKEGIMRGERELRGKGGGER